MTPSWVGQLFTKVRIPSHAQKLIKFEDWGTLSFAAWLGQTTRGGPAQRRHGLCVCAALAARDYEAAAVHVSYGQRTEERERQSFLAICRRLKIRRQADGPQRSPACHRGLGADRSNRSPCPKRKISGKDIPVTYVPFRNAHFLSVAVSWAEVLGAEKVYIGAVEPDSSGYPDCRPAYYKAFNEVIKAGTKEGRIEIVTPLIAMHKAEIIRLGLELGAPFDLTWSCYSREDRACGVCDSCVLRLRAFEAAGVPRSDSLRREITVIENSIFCREAK